MLSRIRRHKRIAALVLVCFIGCGVAAAAWLITGHGQGRARIGSLTVPTISPGSLPATPNTILPGGDGSAYVNINNGNGVPLLITGTSPGDGSGSPDTCPTGNLTVNTKTGLSISVPAGASTVEIPNAYHLASTAPTSCQGATPTLDLNVSFSTP